jgi:Fe-S cluster assembly protein SufD
MSEIQFHNTINHLFEAQDTNAESYIERKKAWQIFEKIGLPTAKSEAYRHIHSQLTGRLDYTQKFNKNATFLAENYFYDIDAFHLAVINGVAYFKDSYLQGADNYFSIKIDQQLDKELDKEIRTRNKSLSQKFLNKQNNDPFLKINNAIYNQDIGITIHDNVDLIKPLIIYFIGQYDENNFTHPRISIDAKENSNSKIIISYHDQRLECGFINSHIFFYLNKGAYVDLVTLQSSKQNTSTILNNTICLQGENSTFNSYTYSIGESVVRNNLLVELNATNAKTNLYGLAKSSNIGFIDNHTTVIHNAEFTHSNELYKNIIDDNSTVTFNGEIYVCKDAQKTTAFQASNNILLSDTATVHAKPQLEIFADDVKCSHGATIGQPSMEEIFYLRSRGIPEEVAKELLVDAFAEIIVEKMDISAVRQIIQCLLKK